VSKNRILSLFLPGAIKKDGNRCGIVLIIVMFGLFMLILLAVAVVITSTSQFSLDKATSTSVVDFYVVQLQLQWAAYQLQIDPYYDGSDVYDYEEHELVDLLGPETYGKINQVIITVQNLTPINPLETTVYRVSAYVSMTSAYGQEDIARRVDATITRVVEEPEENVYQVTATITNWEEVVPPQVPF
jgi:hypothetical protein